ncbi:SNF2 family N-terminal domain-containing protein [Xylaria palmicola]|nr:SNF2 family N-terminal domain-containing protein [Xylaria palmicola]
MEINAVLYDTQPPTGSKRPLSSPITQDSEAKRTRVGLDEETTQHDDLDYSSSLNGLHDNPPEPFYCGDQAWSCDAYEGLINGYSHDGHLKSWYNLSAQGHMPPGMSYPSLDQGGLSQDTYFYEDQVLTGLFEETLPFIDFGSEANLLDNNPSENAANNAHATQLDQSVPFGTQADVAMGEALTTPFVDESLGVNIDYDTCFGVIVAVPTSSFKGDLGACSVPVKLQRFGSSFLLHAASSGVYVGSLSNPKLVSALSRLPLRLDASLFISDVKEAAKDSGDCARKSRQKRCGTVEVTREYILRIVLHGLQDVKEITGALLSDAGVFLRHPSADEVIPEVSYDNPHYLRRPGAEMPKLEYLHLDSVPESTESESADRTNSGRLTQILETAQADGELVTLADLSLSPRLRSPLMRHQVLALAMMQEKESGFVEAPAFPSLWKKESSEYGKSVHYRHTITRLVELKPIPALGGILADDMGLGKTLSMLSLICASLDLDSRAKGQGRGVKHLGTLIIAPTSTLNNWVEQILKHIHDETIRVVVYHGPDRKILSSQFEDADIVITTYKILLMEWRVEGETGSLFSWSWLRVVLDEAHHIRNRSSQTFQSACALISKYRWCLTGTPIHNSLDDYGALLSFIRVFPFRQKSNFTSWIVKPIEEKHPLGIGRLQELIRATCLRRVKAQVLSSNEIRLPPRSERVHEVNLHQEDQELYDAIKKLCATRAAGVETKSNKSEAPRSTEKNLLLLINSLRLICNHGEQLLPQAVKGLAEGASTISLDSAVRQIPSNTFSVYEEETDDSLSSTEDQTPTCFQTTDMEINTPVKDDLLAYRPSAKVLALLENLNHERAAAQNSHRARKSVIFSYWVKMLDLVAQALHNEGITFQRMDGQTTLERRRIAMQEFNNDPNCTVLLASIGSSAEGVNLTTACIVHLLEPHWNPMLEAQAVDRVYRIGQAQDVKVIRYVVPKSIETYVQMVQQQKLQLVSQAVNLDTTPEADLESQRWKKLTEILA